MMKELQPIRDTPEDYDKIEKEIARVFRDEIYLPLVTQLAVPKSTIISNSLEDLIGAITSGRITFYRGRFTGRFDAAVSKEIKRLGGTWVRSAGAWSLPERSLPADVTIAIHAHLSRFEQTARKIDRRLSEILPAEIAEKVKLESLFDKLIWKVDKQIVKNLIVEPKLTDYQRRKIAEEYTNNLKLYITGWTEKEIVKLRQKVQTETFKGNRYESMVKTIQQSFRSSQKKAKFLARQETNLLMAKFKAARYTEVGVNWYKWRSVAGTDAHPVRPRHKELDKQSRAGKLFRFDDPPVQEDGQKQNPGEPYNCRCVAIPVVKF